MSQSRHLPSDLQEAHGHCGSKPLLCTTVHQLRLLPPLAGTASDLRKLLCPLAKGLRIYPKLMNGFSWGTPSNFTTTYGVTLIQNVGHSEVLAGPTVIQASDD